MSSTKLFLPELESLAQRDPLTYEALNKVQQVINQNLPSSGNGSPEGVVPASPGTVFVQRDGPNAQQVLWIKDQNNDTSGWRQLGAYGSTPCSGTSKLIAVSTPNSATFYYDGTNGSQPLTIHRADGTDTVVSGNQTVQKLAPSTTHYFYPYYDERSGEVKFVTTATGVGTAVPQAVGSPPYAYSAPVPNAAQQTAALGTVALSNGSCPVTTPATGTTSATVGGWTNGIYISQ
jgi:hypothetical protein